MGLGIKIPKNVFNKGREDFKSSPGFAEDVALDPGRHVCIVIGGRGVDTSAGAKIVIDLKVAGESAQAGGRVSLWYSTDEDKFVHLLRDLTKLGYDVGEVDEKQLAEILEDLKKSKPVVRVTAKQNGDYVNVRLDKVLDDVSATDVDTDGSAADDSAAGGKAGVKEDAHAKAGAKKKATPAPPAEEPEAEAEPEAEPEADAAEDDGLDDLDRAALKKILKEEQPEFTVLKKHTDDDLRVAIRDHRAANSGAESGDEPEGDPKESEQSVELEVGMQVKATVKGKAVLGKIVEINEDGGWVKIKDKANVISKVNADQLELP